MQQIRLPIKRGQKQSHENPVIARLTLGTPVPLLFSLDLLRRDPSNNES